MVSLSSSFFGWHRPTFSPTLRGVLVRPPLFSSHVKTCDEIRMGAVFIFVFFIIFVFIFVFLFILFFRVILFVYMLYTSSFFVDFFVPSVNSPAGCAVGMCLWAQNTWRSSALCVCVGV